ncbi:MAG: thioredoxin domain-containing protein [Acidimicrobiales bacterium]
MNRLANSSSPYLRQHRGNPVHWFEWGEEAFEEARRTGRPVLLSVGYSACHWCHVMAHESFEDDEVAAVMNSLFVNVKVDREERPDVDAVYMDAVQAMTGRGGWPMTVFLTPGGEPFHGGTYYPRETFLRLLAAVDDAWRTKQDQLRQNVDALVELVGRTARLSPADAFDTPVLREQVVRQLTARFDPEWGGFGDAPKFPSTFALETLLREHLRTGDADLRRVVTVSLDSMACGGMYDHIGGGFARYSVDRMWLVPHFEKMLYDQALLARTYVRAWRSLGHQRWHQVACETIDYVLACMRHPSGGFFSAEDADSPGPDGHNEEGLFYTWTPGEVREVLGDFTHDALTHWGITDGGNFEGRSIPNRIHARPDIGRPDVIERCRRAMLTARDTRPRPGLDDKVLTEWNAMFLATLAEAAMLTGNDRWRAAAVANGVFLLEHLRDGDGNWRRSWQADAEPRARHAALSHDLAHLVDAFTRLYELTGNGTWLDEACRAADTLVARHWDDVHGGLFTVADDGERLVARQKDIMDNATPSANSTAALAFLRLAPLADRPDLADRAASVLRLLAGVLPQAPSAFCHAMHAFEMSVGTTEVVIPGDNSELVDVYREQWRPHAVLARGTPGTGPLWEGREEGLAYVCRGSVCRLPATGPEALRTQLTSATPT